MSDLNSVNLIGRVVRDIEVRYTQNNVAHSIFSVAVDRSVKRGEQWENEASFVDIEAWGNLAENVRKYSGQGKRICVNGYLLQKKWQKDGVNHSKICVVANSLQLIDRVQQNSQSVPQNACAPSQNNQQSQYQQQAQSYDNGGGYADDLDIPF